MKNILLRIVIVLSILSGFLSYASGIVITERLKNASVKEQRATTSTFSSEDEIPFTLEVFPDKTNLLKLLMILV
jgi:hypothetical protein